jgi:hypothetical protein
MAFLIFDHTNINNETRYDWKYSIGILRMKQFINCNNCSALTEGPYRVFSDLYPLTKKC